MKTYLTLSILVTHLALTACHFGPQTDNMAELRRPEGASIALEKIVDGQQQRDKYLVELVEVRNSGVILLESRTAGPRLVFVPWTEIYSMRLRGLDERRLRGASNRNRSEREMERMRVLSRYPQGLSDSQLEDLLGFYKQQNLEPIEN